jgi:hypothetical protein
MPACLRQDLSENFSLSSVGAFSKQSNTALENSLKVGRVVIFVAPLQQSGRSDVHFACTLAEA